MAEKKIVAMPTWLDRFAPDFAATFRRFGFAILLAAVAAAIAIAGINEVVWLSDEAWARSLAGVGTGAVLAVAGVFFGESRPEARGTTLALTYGLPVVAIAAFQVYDTAWIVPFALPVVAVLWLSVSAFTRPTRGAERLDAQDRFWWLNLQAVTTAIIAIAGFIILGLGIAAIERSLSMLFGLATADIFYRFVLPFTGLFLTPVYWLATLPRLSDYDPRALEQPEFIPRAGGFLGQFVLAPLLLIYGLILLAYTAQIVIAQRLPEGLIGWMVLGFVTIGAANWLLLHPPFMRSKPLVGLFRRWWFWLTLVPLALFFAAVLIRIDAYGLTPERLVLLAGGVWAALLAGLFMLGRGDIRAIPAIAGALLLLLSVGPWNFANMPVLDQVGRLEALLRIPGEGGGAVPPRPNWSAEQQAAARSAIEFLAYDPPRREKLQSLLQRHGLEPQFDYPEQVLARLGYSVQPPELPDPGGPRSVAIRRDLLQQTVDVSATPLLIGVVTLYPAVPVSVAGMTFEITASQLRVRSHEGAEAETDLAGWLAQQEPGRLADPALVLQLAGRTLRLVVDALDIMVDPAGGPTQLAYLQGALFTDRATTRP